MSHLSTVSAFRRRTSVSSLMRAASDTSCALAAPCAHVWCLSRQRFHSDCEELFAFLDDSELARAESFYAEDHRREFVIARALLKTLIAGYCGCTPREVRFEYGSRGKPALISELRRSRNLSFNMSHSADAVLIAITSGIEVGVDVEEISSGTLGAEAIENMCINSQEAIVLNSASDRERPRMLLRYWTHKEAYLKAIGCGLSLPPQHLTVRFLDFQRSVIYQGNPREKDPLFGHDLPPGSGYAGAIVVPMRIEKLRYFGSDTFTHPVPRIASLTHS
jgi:4'-phosphopantetheinyl transferase